MNSRQAAPKEHPARTIDITPTWGEWGNIYARFAESGQTDAVRALRADLARAVAGAQALKTLVLTEEQAATVSKVLVQELGKQGY